MASSPFPFLPTVNHHNHQRAPPPTYNYPAARTIHSTTFCYSASSKIYLHRSFPFKRNSCLGRCRATGSPSEPPSGRQTPPSSGVTPKDTVQIFFAVLFWMSLFFWSCAWDGGDRGKPNKGSWFKK